MLLDWLLLNLTLALTIFGLMPFGVNIRDADIVQFLLTVFLWLAYFTVSEGIWGSSLGKFAFELRVVRCRDNNRPGLALAVTRVLLLLVFWLFNDMVLPLVYGDADRFAKEHSGWYFCLELLTPLIAVALVVLPMRKRNGYRGLHEWLSGTRVIQLPDIGYPACVTMSESGSTAIPLRVTDNTSQTIAGYTIIGERPTPLHPSTLVATDCHLTHRLVWIVLDTPGSTGQRMWRPTRLAFLNGGIWEGRNWEAYLAPEGVALTECVPLTWRVVRSMLEQLADELTQACEDGSLPDHLELYQVWIGPSGQIQLLDVARERAMPPEEEKSQAQNGRCSSCAR